MNDLIRHLQSPDSQRDQIWEKSLFSLLPRSNVTLLSDMPQNGPDNFPYFLVEVKKDSTESFVNVLQFASTKGIGIVLNPDKVFPDYIFPYGLLWNYRERGQFLTDAPIQVEKEIDLELDHAVVVGPPHESYLPKYVRQLLNEFLLHQGVLQPKILVIGKDEQFDLCFSIESLQNPPPDEHQGVLRAISWFLPAHYSIALVSESNLGSFTTLV